MDMFQVVALALCTAAVISILKVHKPEFVIPASVSAGVLLLILILEQLRDVLSFLETFQDMLSYGNSYFTILWKVLAIAYIADFTAQICRDAGETALGSKVEVAGKVLMFCAAIPMMEDLLHLVEMLIPAKP